MAEWALQFTDYQVQVLSLAFLAAESFDSISPRICFVLIINSWLASALPMVGACRLSKQC